MHFETGIIGLDENEAPVIHVQMDELPCISPHVMDRQSDDQTVFRYEGQGMLAGFISELVFEVKENGFKLTHRWAFNEDLQDRSWCELDTTPSS